MARNRHNGAFVIGTLVGGAVGALTALWKTPFSGAELRQKLGLPGESGARERGEDVVTVSPAPQVQRETRPLTARALGLIEQAAAPLVGVKLGQTANNSQPGTPAARAVSSPDAGTPSERISDTEFTDFPAQQPVGTSQG